MSDAVVSRARIDRAYVSAHLVAGGAPEVQIVSHLRPGDDRLVAQRSRGGAKKSDHAAVHWTVRYSDTEMEEGVWRMPRHLLTGDPEHESLMHELQHIIDEAVAQQNLTALQRLT